MYSPYTTLPHMAESEEQQGRYRSTAKGYGSIVIPTRLKQLTPICSELCADSFDSCKPVQKKNNVILTIIWLRVLKHVQLKERPWEVEINLR